MGVYEIIKSITDNFRGTHDSMNSGRKLRKMIGHEQFKYRIK
jgi:hypothetical protein